MSAAAVGRHSWRMRPTAALVVLAAALTAAPLLAAEKPGRQTERAFLAEAARGNALEQELGRLATRRSENKRVKAFGRRMLDDHTKLESQLKGVAQKEGVSLPTRLSEDQRKQVDRLSKLRGADFDREYISMMVHDHEEDVGKFHDKAENAADPAVKSLASQALPTLQSHLQEARDIKSSLSRATSGVPGTGLH